MPLTPRTLVLWISGNVAAAVMVPMAFGWWLRYQERLSDVPLPGEFNPTTIALAVGAAWVIFLVLLNVTVGLFLWLKGG